MAEVFKLHKYYLMAYSSSLNVSISDSDFLSSCLFSRPSVLEKYRCGVNYD